MEIPTEGIEPVGGDSPEAAVDVLLGAIERLDVAAVLATLNPDEFQALQRYAPLFIDDLQDQLDAIEGVSIAFPHRTYEVSGSGDTRDVTMTRLTAEITADGESATIDLSNGCWTVESAGERVDSCDTPGSMPPLDEVVDDPEQIEQLLQTLQATFDDYDQPGLIVERVDGKWFFSPMATGSEQLLALIRALSREEIENLQEQVMDLSGSFDVFDRVAGPVPASDEDAGATGASVPVVDDPAEECWEEVDAPGADRPEAQPARMPSRVSSSTAPNNVCTSPEASTTTRAGWAGTSKRSYTRPGSSLIWGNVRPWRSMNAWNSSSLPDQATPTKSTVPAHRCAAASTEAASRLQVVQYGAQNHSARSRPA